MAIVINAAKCNECGEVKISLHRHDFRTCKCGNISVDGGTDYIKRSCATTNYVELSVCEVNGEYYLVKDKN